MPAALASRLKEMIRTGALQLPAPGAGSTPQRHHALSEWGRMDLSLARVAEAHTDALAILAEAGHAPRSDALYGVWASDAPPSQVTCRQLDNGDWCIEGIKHFCSGATFVDAALVTANHQDEILLFDIPCTSTEVIAQPSRWASFALADTATTAVQFASVTVPGNFQIGGPGWYLSRPGFWHGAIGPTCCWAGGALTLIDAALRANRRDPHSRAHLGALTAIAWGLDAILKQAGQDIDTDPRDIDGNARTRGLTVRHLVERWCTEVLDRFGRATGPQLLANDQHIVLQHAALALYIRQCHAERDLESLAG